MVTAIACVLLLAQAADGVGLETPKGWTRTEDPQKRFVAYRPPDVPAGRDCNVLVYPPIDVDAGADALVDQMVRNLSLGKRMLGPVQKVDVGRFRAAIVSLQTPQGWREVLAIHGVVFGRRGQGVLFAASDGDLFKQHSATVAGMLAKATIPAAAPPPAAQTPAAGTFAGLSIPFPAGWTRQDDPSGWIVVTPPQALSFGNPKLWIGPSKKIEGSPWAAHRELLKALIEQAKWPGSTTDTPGATAGPFIRSTAHCSTDARTIILFTAAAVGRMESLAINPTGGDELIGALLPILAKTTLKNGSGEGPRRPEIVEAYRRPNMKKFINADGSFFYGSLSYERLCLLSNGVVDFTSVHAEGFDGSSEVLRG